MASALGARIRELRLAQGLSQRALAARVKVGYPHISKIEVGTEAASSDLIERLADALQADPDELFLLADRLPDEVSEIVRAKRELATQFLRTWNAGGISDRDVERLLTQQKKT